jgi:hypothetical protein
VPAGDGPARLAYADPPYPGQSKRHYGNHPDYAGEVDHAALVEQLAGYDGWALSTSMVALRDVLPLAPPATCVAAWVNTNAEPPGARPLSHHLVWEPLLVLAARRRPDVKNAWIGPPHTAFYGGQIVGQKHPSFLRWLFNMLGAEPGDSLDDIFPGSGAVGRAWAAWSTQLALPTEPREQLALA